MTKRIFLVYQPNNEANVFLVDCHNLRDYDRNAKSLYRGDWKTAATVARAFEYAGYIVQVAGCLNSGTITNSTWTDVLHTLPFYNDIEIV